MGEEEETLEHWTNDYFQRDELIWKTLFSTKSEYIIWSGNFCVVLPPYLHEDWGSPDNMSKLWEIKV